MKRRASEDLLRVQHADEYQQRVGLTSDSTRVVMEVLQRPTSGEDDDADADDGDEAGEGDAAAGRPPQLVHKSSSQSLLASPVALPMPGTETLVWQPYRLTFARDVLSCVPWTSDMEIDDSDSDSDSSSTRHRTRSTSTSSVRSGAPRMEIAVPYGEIRTVSLAPTYGPGAFQIELAETESVVMRCLPGESPNHWMFTLHRAIASFIAHRRELDHEDKGPAGSAMFEPSTLAVYSSVAVGAMQGRRENMEDENVVIEDANGEFDLKGFPYQSFFGVYDGHSGIEAAEYLTAHLVEEVVSDVELLRSDPRTAITNAFARCDKAILEKAAETRSRGGTTATLCMLRDRQLLTANVGDCRAVMRKTTGQVVPLSFDHRPTRADERARVEAAGGWIVTRNVLNIPKMYAIGMEELDELDDDELEERVGLVEVSRVCGVLGMTRSVGDILIKTEHEATFGTTFTADVVSSEPEFTEVTLDDESHFVLIACDGLFDVFSNDEVCDLVAELLASGKTSQEVCDLVMAAAFDRGSIDNITVILVLINEGKKAAE